MQRVKTFYWRTGLQVPDSPQSFTYSELAWIHDENFIRNEGDGWTVVGNSVVTVLGENEILMATTMVREVDDSVPDTL